MKNKRYILGIDPALNRTGWGIITAENNNLSYIASGIIDAKKIDNLPDKISKIYGELNKVIIEYKPKEAAIEEIFVNKNPLTSMKLGHARGAAIISCMENNLAVSEYATNKIKKTICGQGKGEKQQVAMMVKVLLPQAEFYYDDESDALAAAICHSQQINISCNSF